MATVVDPLVKKLPTENIAPSSGVSAVTPPVAPVSPVTPVGTGVVPPKLDTTPGEFSGKVMTPKPIGAPQPTGILGAVDTVKNTISNLPDTITGGLKQGVEAIKTFGGKVGTVDATPAPTISAPDYSLPHSQGDVWNGTAWALPGTPAAQTPAGAVKKVDTSKLTPEQLAVYNANQKHFDNINTLSGMEDVINKLGVEAKRGAEEKYAKDVGEMQQDLQTQTDLARQAKAIQAQQNLDAAKASLAKSVNNANYFRGATGFAQTQTALQAQSDQLDKARNLIKDIENLNSISEKIDANVYASKMRDLQEALDSNVSQSIQKQMANLGILIQTGKLDSVEAINKARTDLKETLTNEYNTFLQKNFEASKFVLQQAEKALESVKKDNTYSKDVTAAHPDGFMYSANNTVMRDSLGQPIRVTKGVDEKIDNKDGTYTLRYSDGTWETRQAGEDTTRKIDEKNSTNMPGGYARNANGDIITDRKTGEPMKYVPETKPVTLYINGEQVSGTFDPKTNVFTPVGGGSIGGGVGGGRITGTGVPSQARTDRNNNPTAMTTDVAKTLGLVEGVDYVEGDKFPDSNLKTAKFLNDPFETTVRALDLAANSPDKMAFFTQKGQKRWTHTAMSDEQWQSLSADQKLDAVKKMYANETPANQRGLLPAAGTQALGATAKTLFEKVLAGKNTEADDKKLKQMGYTQDDIDAYAESKPGVGELERKAQSLTQGLGGTAEERAMYTKNIIDTATENGISLQDAKKKLGYKSADDVEFAKMRKEEYQSLKKSTKTDTAQARTALILLNEPQTAIGDVASVVGFLKTIDPASVAREAEVAAVENARGIIDTIGNVFSKLDSGKKLTAEQRTQLKNSITTIVNAADKKYAEELGGMIKEFNDRGLDPTTYISAKEVQAVKKESAKSNVTRILDIAGKAESKTGVGTTTPDRTNFSNIFNSK